jgi:hypothetical protein
MHFMRLIKTEVGFAVAPTRALDKMNEVVILVS